MRLNRPFALGGVSLLVALGCTDVAGIRRTELAGTWTRAPENLSPSGWHQHWITFAPSGAFVHDWRSYGVYPGQSRDQLSAYARTEGAYRTEGDRLIMTPHRLVTWDRFYGPSTAERMQEPYPYSGYLDDARYVVRGNTLTLHYTVYPADAPVPTTMVLRRVE